MCSGTGRTSSAWKSTAIRWDTAAILRRTFRFFWESGKKKGLHLKAIRELMPKLVQATAEIKSFPTEAAETAKEKPDPAIPGKADEVPEVVVDLLPEREAEQLADTVMRQEEEERQTEFYRVLGRLLDQMIQKRRQEERSRRVDEAIRRHQQSRREAAATLEQKGKRTKAKRGHRNNG